MDIRERARDIADEVINDIERLNKKQGYSGVETFRKKSDQTMRDAFSAAVQAILEDIAEGRIHATPTASSREYSDRSSYGKTSLIEDVTANTQGYNHRQVTEIIETALETIKRKVQAGQIVTLTGFGTFRRTERAARTGTNIRTREKINIPAQTSVRFTPGSEFKAAVSGRSTSRSRSQSGRSQSSQQRERGGRSSQQRERGGSR